MSVTIVLGSQWGDEGKGKIVDLLSQSADMVARYQGGANAGHTIVFRGKQHILHLIPSGILNPEVVCLIGNGVVIDPEAFVKELNELHAHGIDTNGRLFISSRAQIILPYHKIIDKALESANTIKAIGTTGRGIGPAYVDKASRIGIRMIDLLNEKSLENKIKDNLEHYNCEFTKVLNIDTLNFDSMFEEFMANVNIMKPFIADTALMISKAMKAGKKIIVEGAQGALLDVDHGTYPFVTSSNPTAGGACTGLGIPPNSFDKIIAVVKAYCTRVGNGPFPTEQINSIGERLRATGSEFGATTGRPRRCGWLDLFVLKYSTMINGFTDIALTKLDVLNDFEEIKICSGYKTGGEIIESYPTSSEEFSAIEPEYITMKGWMKSLSGIRTLEALPNETREYLSKIEEISQVKISYISLSPDREDTIII
ncbi:MAG: Adenylosuccinate synthetase [Ignavibacteria bacterium]|nr:Adenylosuccinate synthetase [Ignavibacteria bacterium]